MNYRIICCLALLACTGGEEAARRDKLERLRALGLEFTWVEPGVFAMGTSGAQEALLRGKELWDDLSRAEQPVREVAIEQGFFLSTYEITQAQWTAVTGTWPWLEQEHVMVGPDYPAVYVSWRDAQQFIRQLNVWVGDEIFRLPTEAEWEYACRAGSDALWFFGDDEVRLGEYAWYKGNAWDAERRFAQVVGGKRANGWGLYDMYGNVWEWCQDWEALPDSSGYKPVLRGGSFYNGAANVRSALKIRNDANFRFSDIGFRIVRDAPVE